MPVKDREAFHRTLDGLPELQIEEMLRQGHWSNDRAKQKAVEEYLHQKQAERQKAMSAEALSVAWWALAIGGLSLMVSLFALFKGW
jgi:hypothetical protein